MEEKGRVVLRQNRSWRSLPKLSLLQEEKKTNKTEQEKNDQLTRRYNVERSKDGEIQNERERTSTASSGGTTYYVIRSG